ncbi:membrane protein insertase YidC [Cryomorphaceae bacterium 1068]|nr:membrane protein insertase YidC [Cryomorphaceae bacterium 1068]
MDKNSVIGLVLIAILLVGYSLFTKPSDEEIAAQQRAIDSVAALQAEEDAVNEAEASTFIENEIVNDTVVLDSASKAEVGAELKARYGVLAAASEGASKEITVTTDLLEITFSNKGGVPVKANLLKYTTYDSMPLILFDEETAKMGYEFTYPSLGNLNSSNFFFTASEGSKTISGEDSDQITFTLEMEGGRKIENIYTISGNAYDIGMETRFYDVDGVVTSPKLVWEMTARHNEKGIDIERNNSTIFYKAEGEGRDYLSETGDDDDIIDDEKLQWVAFKQHFFSAILIANGTFNQGVSLASKPFEEEVTDFTQFYRAEFPVDPTAASTVFSAQLYMGPNDYKVLKEYGMELDKVINLGWGIFGWVNKWVVIPIFDWLERTGLSFGINILILTIIIKLVLSPLTFKNYLSSAKMRVIKPEVDEINEKFKDADPMKKQQATMDLYRKTGVNPFSGCIPMIIQMPILYAMFRFFPSSIQLRHEPFLWADDLSAYDSIYTLPFTIPAYGDHVSLFTILMAVSMFFYTIYNTNQMPQQTQPGMPNMKVIMYIFPFMMLFFFNSFASGLSYYYFLANMFSIAQMLVIKNFFIDEDKIHAKIQENKKKKANKGKSRFQKKLEDMAKQRGINPN